jgi:outer membrane protein assembly factor BamD
MNSPRCLIYSLILSFCVAGAGCAWFGTKENAPVEELAATGMELYNRKKYRDALETFQNLKEWYPFSKYTSLAELKIADAHYQLKEYEEAIFAYQEFKSLHPLNEAIPYVIYQMGLCYFDRMDSIDRDQTVVHQALETFQQLTTQYPESPYAVKARKHIDESKKSLAGHEMDVGRFYYKTKHYKGALARFQGVLSDYPNVGYDQEARQYIDLCQEALEKDKLINFQ